MAYDDDTLFLFLAFFFTSPFWFEPMTWEATLAAIDAANASAVNGNANDDPVAKEDTVAKAVSNADPAVVVVVDTAGDKEEVKLRGTSPGSSVPASE